MTGRDLFVVASVSFAVSCAADGSLAKRLSVLQRGAARSRALQLLGAPDTTLAEDDDEVLEYCGATASEGGADSSDYALVWLYKGTVTGVTTYRRALKHTTSCAVGFKAIHWEDAPDRLGGSRNP
jgi:hypothetical protein